MASTLKTKGIILKMKDTPGKDKLVYFLTEKGLVKAFMTPKRMAGKKSFTVDLFSYGEIVYFETDSGNNLVNSVTPEEYFYGIRENISSFYGAGYFASLALYTLQDAETDTVSLLNLILTSFDRLSKGEDVKSVKPVFELIISKLLGIFPCLEAQTKSNNYYFAFDDGRLHLNAVAGSIFVSRNVIMAVYRIINSSIKDAFDVKCENEDMLYRLSEQYILYHTEYNFDTLKYLNGVI